MPKLTASASKSEKKARMQTEMGKYAAGKLHSGSKKGPKVVSRRQAIAISLSESGQSKRSGKRSSKRVSK